MGAWVRQGTQPVGVWWPCQRQPSLTDSVSAGAADSAAAAASGKRQWLRANAERRRRRRDRGGSRTWTSRPLTTILGSIAARLCVRAGPVVCVRPGGATSTYSCRAE